MRVITLTTDYGTQDYYVGAIKGVILGIAPDARVVDITHEVAPHNILQGAFVLRQVWPWYPEGTIHVAIVDPGVGSERRIVIAQYAGRLVVAPDNGLLTLLHRDFPVEGVYVVEARRYLLAEISTTFHGRDIMAPVAAHLANGVAAGRFGRATDCLELLTVPHRGEETADAVEGAVLYVDRFGTLVTNIGREQLHRPRGDISVWQVWLNEKLIGPIRSTFSDVSPGEPMALIGSCGLLEIAVNQGSAASRFGPTDAIHLEVRRTGRES